MEKLYHSLKTGTTSDEDILEQFRTINISQVEEFEDGMNEKFMSILLEKYKHLFDDVFKIISEDSHSLKLLMDNASPEEHVFHWYLRYIDLNDVSLVLDIIEKYWTREEIRMYHLIYSLEEYQEIRNTMAYLRNNCSSGERRRTNSILADLMIIVSESIRPYPTNLS